MNKSHLSAEEIPNRLSEQQHNEVFQGLESDLLESTEPSLSPSMEMNTHEQILAELFAEMDKDELLELADFTMSNMVGKVFREIFAEEGKDNPDQELIARLKKEKKDLLGEERRILFSSDEETQRQCIRKYSPILRAMVSKDENKSHLSAEEISNRLSEQQHNEIFQGLESDLLESTEPSLSPSIVIVGGQAGAGKTSLKRHLGDTIFANKTPAVIDSARYRERHPNFSKIIETDEKELYKKTNEDVREWTAELLESSLKNSRDIILETTMRNTDKTLKTIKKIKEEHPQYKIHIVCLSVNPEVSRTGIMIRYFGQKASNGYGRFVSIESHDKTC